MPETILEKYNDLSVYYAIKRDINRNLRFYNQIAEDENNCDKSQQAKDSINFAAWFLLHRFGVSYNAQKVAELICDGTDDKQIDAVYQNDSVLTLIQCKWTQYPLSKEDISDVESVWNNLKSIDGFEGCNDQLGQYVPLIKQFYHNPVCTIRILLVSPTNLTNGGKKENEDWLALKRKIENAGRASHVVIDYYGCEELRQLLLDK